MNRKTEIGLAVGILVLLILVVGYIIFRQQTKTVVHAPEPSTPAVTTTTPGTTPTTPPVPVPAPVVSPTTTSMIFVERFSSYSSESNFANVTDVLPLVTASLGARLQAAAKDQQTQGADKAYYGISTKVISQKVTSQTDAAATLLVSTQRAESIGSPGNTTVRYQDITVKLVKQGDSWKVDDYTWAQ